MSLKRKSQRNTIHINGLNSLATMLNKYTRFSWMSVQPLVASPLNASHLDPTQINWPTLITERYISSTHVKKYEALGMYTTGNMAVSKIPMEFANTFYYLYYVECEYLVLWDVSTTWCKMI